MRKFTFLGLLVIFSLLIFSCFTIENTVPQQNTAQTNSNIQLLNPEELFGKNLVGFNLAGSRTAGYNRDDIFRLRVNDGGTFELIINEVSLNGTWSFDINAKPYRYVFEWFDGGEKQVFNMNFFRNRDEIVWMGRHFDPAVNRTIGLQFVIEE